MFSLYKKLLQKYVSFQSISTDSAFLAEMQKTVSWLTKIVEDYGFRVEIWKGKQSNEVVFAEYIQDPKLETILVYGHYDVQPADLKDGWGSDPWNLRETKGRLVARGVVDNKGQNLIHIVAIGDLIRKKNLGYNIKFLIEGNEETGNPDMQDIVRKNKAKLQADYIIISDGEIVGDSPTIEASLRGGGSFDLIFKTGKTNLHSGLFGGAVPNAAHELQKFLANLYDKENKVAIPGFYDDVDPVTPLQKKNNKNLATEKEILKNAKTKILLPEKGMDFYSQVGLRPTIQVTGMMSGYMGEGFANIVPCEARAKVNVRLVASQNPKKVFSLIEQYIKKNVPNYIECSMKVEKSYDPIKLDIGGEKVKEVRKLLEQSYGKKVKIKYVGGGVPIVSDFKRILGKDTLLVSLGNDDCNMHGVDENFKIDLIKKGLQFSSEFFAKN
jgi:acetylornithine deacetylase/succinyl-diaminopimelate desuccinylase-like protein